MAILSAAFGFSTVVYVPTYKPLQHRIKSPFANACLKEPPDFASRIAPSR